MLQPPSRLEQGGPAGGAQLSGSGSGDIIPCGPVRHEGESVLRGCKSDKSGIWSLGPPSQPLPIADVAASAGMLLGRKRGSLTMRPFAVRGAGQFGLQPWQNLRRTVGVMKRSR